MQGENISEEIGSYRKIIAGEKPILLGHCNISQDRIFWLTDHRNKKIVYKTVGKREVFFSTLASFIPDKKEQAIFLDTYLNKPLLAAYQRGELEKEQTCFMKLPDEQTGRYIHIKVSMLKPQGSSDINGILTVSDVTEQMVSNKMLQQLSVDSYDLVLDVNLNTGEYTVVSGNSDDYDGPGSQGVSRQRIQEVLQQRILPKDRTHVAKMLSERYMRKRLGEAGAYSIFYSMLDQKKMIATKKLTVYPIDLRIGRVCLSRADITESMQEQQSILRIMANTFEVLAFIRCNNRKMKMYTKQAVLENFPPLVFGDYNKVFNGVIKEYSVEDREAVKKLFTLENMMDSLEENPEGYHFVLPHVEGGEKRYKQVNIYWGDSAHSTVCMVRADVTDMLMEEKQTQSALENALRMAEEANRAKSDFLSSMSHDIRTPMNAIMGMTTLALAKIGDQKKVKECLQKISLSSQHLLSLINDILDMSKIESSKVMLNNREIYLPDLLQQLLAIMQPQAEDAGLTLNVQTENIQHRHFYGDFLRINQILINVLGNAIKFTPQGGNVLFRVEETKPVRNENNIHYCFTVSDSGVGMSEKFMEHLFEPFIRSQNMERVEGTGLGLSISKGLVDLMQGSVSVESRLEEGTTFLIHLEFEPVANPQRVMWQGGTDSEQQEEIDLSGYCFLMAEDNDINAEILCELLKMRGARTVVQANGEAAVREFAKAPAGTYDAVLMDIQMPVMNGYEATKAIREMEREDGAVIPIIAMTANAFAEDIQATLKAGMNAHVGKPIDENVLMEILQKELHI